MKGFIIMTVSMLTSLINSFAGNLIPADEVYFSAERTQLDNVASDKIVWGRNGDRIESVDLNGVCTLSFNPAFNHDNNMAFIVTKNSCVTATPSESFRLVSLAVVVSKAQTLRDGNGNVLEEIENFAGTGNTKAYVALPDDEGNITISNPDCTTDTRILCLRVVYHEIVTESPSPSIFPSRTMITSDSLVRISCPDYRSEIFFTNDGSIPDSFSTRYVAPFELTVSGGRKVKAIAYLYGLGSDVVEKDYHFRKVLTRDEFISNDSRVEPVELDVRELVYARFGQWVYFGSESGREMFLACDASGHMDKIDPGHVTNYMKGTLAFESGSPYMMVSETPSLKTTNFYVNIPEPLDMTIDRLAGIDDYEYVTIESVSVENGKMGQYDIDDRFGVTIPEGGPVDCRISGFKFAGKFVALKIEKLDPDIFEISLRARPASMGSVWIGDDPSSISSFVNDGDSVLLHSSAYNGFVFREWRIGSDFLSADSDWFYAPAADAEVVGLFDYVIGSDRSVTVRSSDPGKGSVEIVGYDLLHVTGRDFFRLRAVPAGDDHSFDYWSDGAGSVISRDDEFVYDGTDDIELTANFSSHYTVTYPAYIQVDGLQSGSRVDEGGEIKVSVSAPDGRFVKAVVINGCDSVVVGRNDKVEFTHIVSGTTEIDARFEPFPTTCPAPSIMPVDGLLPADSLVSLECDDPLADIYYTVDGSDPIPADSLRYEAPFSLSFPHGMTVKAIAVWRDVRSEIAVRRFYRDTVGSLDDFIANDNRSGSTSLSGNLQVVASTSSWAIATQVCPFGNPSFVRLIGKFTDKLRPDALIEGVAGRFDRTDAGMAIHLDTSPRIVGDNTDHKVEYSDVSIADISPDLVNSPVSVREVKLNPGGYVYNSDGIIQLVDLFGIGLPKAGTGLSRLEAVVGYEGGKTVLYPVSFDTIPELPTVCAPITAEPDGREAVDPDVRVVLGCATPGAVIRYTLDGSAPGKSSPIYSSPITLTLAQRRLRAVAYAEGTDTVRLSADYRFSRVSDIRSFIENDNRTDTTMIDSEVQVVACGNGTMVVTAMDPDRRDCFLRLGYQGAAEYGRDDILAGVGGILKTVDSVAVAEMANWARLLGRNIQSPVAYPVSALSALRRDMANNPVCIRDVRFGTDGCVRDSACAVRLVDLFGIGLPMAGTALSRLEAVVGYEGGKTVLYPVSFDTIPERPTVCAPITAEPDGREAVDPDVRVVLGCETPGAVIRYTLDGSAPGESSPLYSSPITLTLTQRRLRAVAYAEGTDTVRLSADYRFSRVSDIRSFIENDNRTDTTMIDSEVQVVACGNGTVVVTAMDPDRRDCFLRLGYQGAAKYGRDDILAGVGGIIKTADSVAVAEMANRARLLGRNVHSPITYPITALSALRRDIANNPVCIKDVRFGTDGCVADSSCAVRLVDLFGVGLPKSGTGLSRLEAVVGYEGGKTVLYPVSFDTMPERPTVCAPITAEPDGREAVDPDVRVVLGCETPGAVIRYTLDGSAPGKSSPIYSYPITLTLTQRRLRAIAYAEGTDTVRLSADYRFSRVSDIRSFIENDNRLDTTMIDSEVQVVACGNGTVVVTAMDTDKRDCFLRLGYQGAAKYGRDDILAGVGGILKTVDSVAVAEMANRARLLGRNVHSPITYPITALSALRRDMANNPVCIRDIRLGSDGCVRDSSCAVRLIDLFGVGLPMAGTALSRLKAVVGYEGGKTMLYPVSFDTIPELPTVCAPITALPDGREAVDPDVRVVLGCETPGAVIRYTLDGSAPGKSSPIYSYPITLTLTQRRLRAVAYAEGTDTVRLSADYRFSRVSDIRSFIENDNRLDTTMIDSEVQVVACGNGTVVVTAMDPDRRDCFLRLGYQGAAKYGRDDILAGVGGILKTVDSVAVAEMANRARLLGRNIQSPVAYPVSALSALRRDMANNPVCIRDVRFGTDGCVADSSCAVRLIDLFGVGLPMAGTALSRLKAVVGYEGGKTVLYPVEMTLADIPPGKCSPILVSPSPAEPISPSQKIEMACGTENAKIYYTLDGSEPTELSTPYTEGFTVSPRTSRIRAIAFGENTDTVKTDVRYRLNEVGSIADFIINDNRLSETKITASLQVVQSHGGKLFLTSRRPDTSPDYITALIPSDKSLNIESGMLVDGIVGYPATSDGHAAIKLVSKPTAWGKNTSYPCVATSVKLDSLSDRHYGHYVVVSDVVPTGIDSIPDKLTDEYGNSIDIVAGEVTPERGKAYDITGTVVYNNGRLALATRSMSASTMDEFSIRVATADSNQGSVYIGGEGIVSAKIARGSGVTIHAKAATGYEFSEWRNGPTTVSREASYEFKPESFATYTAYFINEQSRPRTVTVRTSAQTKGTAEIVTPETGHMQYTGSEKVTVRAIPSAPQHQFTGWTNQHNDTLSVYPTFTYTDTASVILTANFKTYWPVSITQTSGGTAAIIDEDGILPTGMKPVEEGSILTFIANASKDSVISEIRINGVTMPTGPQQTDWKMEWTVSDTTELAVVFAPGILPIYRVETGVNDPLLGRAYIGVPDVGEASVAEGTEIPLVAEAAEGCEFLWWEFNGIKVGDKPSQSIAVSGNGIYTAVFDRVMHNARSVVISSANPTKGTVRFVEPESNSTGIYIQTRVIVEATALTPADRFLRWTNDRDSTLSLSPQYIYTHPESVTLKAHFASRYRVGYSVEGEGTLTVAAPNGSLLPNGSEVDDSTKITVKAYPGIGMKLASLRVNGMDVEEDPDGVFTTRVERHTEIEAEFTKIMHSVTFESGIGGTIEIYTAIDAETLQGTGDRIESGDEVAEGCELFIFAVADDGYRFDRITIGDRSYSSDNLGERPMLWHRVGESVEIRSYFTEKSGVEETPWYDGETEYYNLFGIKVPSGVKPSPGVYIERSRSGTRKIVVR